MPKTLLITGASSGIGRATAELFAARGWNVAATMRSPEKAVSWPDHLLLYSIYHASKWAVDGFSEALIYELRPFGIRVKIIAPGPIKTDFYDRSMDVMKKEGLNAYDSFVETAMPNMQLSGLNAPGPDIVAKCIYRAATDGTKRLRYPVNSGWHLVAAKATARPIVHVDRSTCRWTKVNRSQWCFVNRRT